MARYKFFPEHKTNFMATKALTRFSSFPTLFDDFFKPWNELFETGFTGRTMTVPAVNIIENKDSYKVSLAAPGLKKEDFNIDLDGNMLTISAEKEETKEEKEEETTRSEYNYTSFSRSFTLPEDVKPENIDAKYEDGILNIVLPKKEEAKKATISKHIAVQ